MEYCCYWTVIFSKFIYLALKTRCCARQLLKYCSNILCHGWLYIFLSETQESQMYLERICLQSYHLFGHVCITISLTTNLNISLTVSSMACGHFVTRGVLVWSLRNSIFVRFYCKMSLDDRYESSFDSFNILACVTFWALENIYVNQQFFNFLKLYAFKKL